MQRLASFLALICCGCAHVPAGQAQLEEAARFRALELTRTASLTRTCLTISYGAADETAFVTQVDGRTPREHHVYASLHTRQPLMVAIDGVLWTATGGRLERVKTP